MNSTKKHTTIFSAVLARFLIQRNFIVKDIKPSHKDKKRTVFVFEETEELVSAIREYAKK